MALNDVIIAIAILATFINGFVIVSLLANKRTRTPFGALLINLTVVDFLVGAFLKTSFYIEDLFEGDQIKGVHCHLMTTFITTSPTIFLMTLIILSYHLILSMIKNNSLEKLFNSNSTFTFIFLLWMLVGGSNFSIHAVYSEKSFCVVEDKLLSASVFYNSFLILILITLHILIISIQTLKLTKRVIPKPEAVYNNLSVEVSSDAFSDDDVDKYNRRVIFVVSLVFLIFWAPFYFLRSNQELNFANYASDFVVYQIYAYILGYFKSVASPIAILLFYPESRFLLGLLRNKFWKCVKQQFCK